MLSQVLGLNWAWVFAIAAVVVMSKQLNLGGGGGEAWLIITEEMVTRFDAFNAARSMLPGLVEDDVLLARTDRDGQASTEFIYTAAGNSMLTPEGLRVLKQVPCCRAPKQA